MYQATNTNIENTANASIRDKVATWIKAHPFTSISIYAGLVLIVTALSV